MHLGRNHRWRPWGFEKNNNHNQKKNIAHITLFLTIVSIQLHSRGWILPFYEAANCRPPSPLWTTYFRCSGNNCLLNFFKEIGPVETEPV